MQARHTQAFAWLGEITSKTLVNRTRMKVVNIPLTKNFSFVIPGCAPAWGADPESVRSTVVMDPGLRLRRRIPE